MPPQLSINPPLLNSASPWATTEDDLRALLLHPSLGAVTTRTSLLAGFRPGPSHRHSFFDPLFSNSSGPVASINSYGYSPLPFSAYLDILSSLPHTRSKTVIVSVAGPAEDVAHAYAALAALRLRVSFPLALEVNLSCPNVPSSCSLSACLSALPADPAIAVGVKLAPMTSDEQFQAVTSSLLEDVRLQQEREDAERLSKLSFITSTNTLGSCLLPSSLSRDSSQGDAPSILIGGMAGPPIHPLSLGNVHTLRRRLNAHPALTHIQIIGVGGVHDAQGFKRMLRAGASAVGLATALGARGLVVFEEIGEGS